MTYSDLQKELLPYGFEFGRITTMKVIGEIVRGLYAYVSPLLKDDVMGDLEIILKEKVGGEWKVFYLPNEMEVRITKKDGTKTNDE